ncbi:MAG TPA: RNA-binding cell elongation regulator Jag/EloR [Acidimicrobiia bacterium]
MAYVEVKAKTIEMAIEAAMRELGVTDRNRLEIEVLQEPERGFLGIGGRDAIVKVSEKKPGRKRSRSRKKKREGRQPESVKPKNSSRPARQGEGKAKNMRPDAGNEPAQPKQPQETSNGPDPRRALSPAEQEPLVREFLEGLLEAVGLEGRVETHMDEDVVVANVIGEQTEALVGPRGSVMEAVHELTKTVLQRAAQDPARVRIDIAGYAERRRQALTIYAGELIQQVLEEGGELMLEPMSAADRKVIHDVVAQHEGVRSYSEGEAPARYVVIAKVETEVAPEEPVAEEFPSEESPGVETGEADALGDGATGESGTEYAPELEEEQRVDTE